MHCLYLLWPPIPSLCSRDTNNQRKGYVEKNLKASLVGEKKDIKLARKLFSIMVIIHYFMQPFQRWFDGKGIICLSECKMLQCSDVNITKVRPLQLSGHYSCWLKPSLSKISACYVSVAHITHIPINIALWFPGVKGNKTFILYFSELFTCFAIPLNVTHLRFLN